MCVYARLYGECVFYVSSCECVYLKYSHELSRVVLDSQHSSYLHTEYQDLSNCVVSEIQVYPKQTSKWSGITKPDHVPRYVYPE